MPVDIIDMCWAIFRVTCRSFAEGVFFYLLLNTSVNHPNDCKKIDYFSKKNMFLFSSVCSFIAVLFSAFLVVTVIYRLVFLVLVFFYFWNKQRKLHKNLIINYNGTRDIWYALTVAIILVLAVRSFNSISHMLFHTSFVLTGIYDTVKSVDIFYQLYKTAIVFLDIFFIFLAYKLRFIKMKDIKAMSAYKRIPISFGLCLISMIYIDYSYNSIQLSIAIYCDTLLWIMAFILPSYIGFYLTTTHLTKLLSIKENYTADVIIHMWLFDPSMFKTIGLSIYDSNMFMSNFETKKIAIRKKLRKLGINDEYKGYSELVLCLFLTSLFTGLKGWSFETNVFWQSSLIIDVPALKVRKDIEEIIGQVWAESEAETLIDGYYLPYHNINIYDQTQRPKVEEFLTDIAKSV